MWNYIILLFFHKFQQPIFSFFGGFLFTIMGGDSLAASLLEAEHEVNPLVKVLRHILALQRHPVLLQEILGVWFGNTTQLTAEFTEVFCECFSQKFSTGRQPEAHGGRTTSPTKLPLCFRPKSRLSLFSRKSPSSP